MINVRNLFNEKLLLDEIRNGLTTPLTRVPKSSKPTYNNPDFPESLNELYRQVDFINIYWQISQREDGEKIVDILNQDPWLKEEYWDEGYEWGIIHEYLSGFINIQKVEDMLNPEFCKEERFYYTIDLNIKEENPDDYIPFDIHWSITACLKKENGKILDNIWLVHADGHVILDMEVTIEKYLELCYKAKGFHYWQLVYYYQNEEYEYTQLMKRYLPMLFPHLEFDLSDFGIN